MRYHGIGPHGAHALAEILKLPHSGITTLDLAHNRLGAGAAHLGAALEINRTLAHLDVSGNNLRADACRQLADMLQYNVTVKTLAARGNHIGDKGAHHFAAALRSNSTLTSLDLSRNDIGDMGAAALGHSLAANDGLKELDISWNNIRGPGFTAFFGSVKDNAVLAHLRIHHNGMGDAVGALALYVSRSGALQTLDLTSTRLSDAALATLARPLEGSHALEEVHFAGNPFTEAGAQIILKAATTSTSLKKINVKDVQMSQETRNKFMSLSTEKSVIVDV
ncbi:hypothetical protein SeMB42_g04243 [Synchytrium endobioticum]|nr:hypothetical protein SeMB42_g04243 [Synchytrium endobioticum]